MSWDGIERRDDHKSVIFDILAEQNEKLDKLTELFGGIHAEQHEYIKRLIEREAKRSEFRSAVIEKTTASLLWSMIVGLGISVWNYLKVTIR